MWGAQIETPLAFAGFSGQEFSLFLKVRVSAKVKVQGRVGLVEEI